MIVYTPTAKCFLSSLWHQLYLDTFVIFSLPQQVHMHTTIVDVMRAFKSERNVLVRCWKNVDDHSPEKSKGAAAHAAANKLFIPVRLGLSSLTHMYMYGIQTFTESPYVDKRLANRHVRQQLCASNSRVLCIDVYVCLCASECYLAFFKVKKYCESKHTMIRDYTRHTCS
jgi:hypothetical protein